MRRLPLLLALLLSLSSRRAEARKTTPPCEELTPAVVGEERCSRFGESWVHEREVPVSLRLGVEDTWTPFAASQPVELSSVNPTGVAGGARTLPERGLAGVRAWGLSLGLEYHLKNLFAGLLFSVGAGGAQLPAASLEPSSPGVGLRGFVGGVGLPVGVSIPLDRVVVRLAAVPQLRLVDLHGASPASALTPVVDLTAVRALVEPRVEVAYFPHRLVSILFWTGTGGAGVTPRSFGLSFVAHLEAYDDDRSLF